MKVAQNINDAQTKLEILVEQIEHPLSVKETGQLITRLDNQVQTSNTQIFAPRIQELEKKRTEALTVLGIDPKATARQIKIAFNDAILKFHPDKSSPNQIDSNVKNQTDTFIQITEAYKFLTEDYPQEIAKVQNALEFQQKKLITFDQKASIARPLSTDQNQKISDDKKDTQDLLDTSSAMNQEAQKTQEDLEKMPKTDEELRMIDMEKRFEEAAQQNAKSEATKKEYSEKLLMNFQVNAEKIKNSVLEPSFAKLPDILNPGLRRRATRLWSQTTAEQEIKSEIIDPYLKAIQDLYNPKTFDLMLPDDQKALNTSYNKALNRYKDELIKYFIRYKKEQITNPNLGEAIDEIANKLDLTEKPIPNSPYFEWPAESHAAATPSRSPYGSAAEQMDYL